MPPMVLGPLSVPPKEAYWVDLSAALRAKPDLPVPPGLDRLRRVSPDKYRCRARGPWDEPKEHWDNCVFRAQDGEDLLYLGRIKASPGRTRPIYPVGPTYLIAEAGAWDGVRFSTTWFFERHLGWRALHFEPSPRNFPALVSNRPGTINVQRALCAAPLEHEMTFVDQAWPDGSGGAVGGIEELMAPSFRTHWHPPNEFASGRSERKPVLCGPLACYLRRLGVRYVDLFVLDVEGAELEALRGFNWDEVRVDTWVIEADTHAPAKNEAVRAIMRERGYRFENVGRNDWFIRNDSRIALN